MKRIFITGGTGFFGKSILSQAPAGVEMVILSRNPAAFRAAHPELARRPGVEWVAGDVRDFAFPEGPFDAIVHAATPASTEIADDEMRSIILDGARRVIDFATASGTRKVLFTSSGAVYGPQTAAVSEDAACRPVTAYGQGKLESERMFAAAGLDVKIARCFAFTGPHLNRDIHYAIGNFMRDCLAGEPIVINGDGTPLRSYLYADDLVEWLFAILERGASGRAYNVGSDQAVSIRELAETVRRVLGARNEIIVRGTPVAGAKPSVYVPSIARVRSELGLRVTVGLEDAIRRSALNG